MKNATYFLIVSMFILACKNDDTEITPQVEITDLSFNHNTTIDLGGEGHAEISAYDPLSKKIFVTDAESKSLNIIEFDGQNWVKSNQTIALNANPNSVSAYNGKVAVAVEGSTKQSPGFIKIYDTNSLALQNTYTLGSLPDMVIYTPDGKYILVANEGEPNDDYTLDPDGTISIINVASGSIDHLTFDAFESQKETLINQGLRIFGKNATFTSDLEPEYIAVTSDSKNAYVTLQENNAIAAIDIENKTITAIYPLGFKNHSLSENSLDPSNRDNKLALRSFDVKGIYQPDAITIHEENGISYIFTANEGDSRDYSGYSEETRVKDLELDPTVFPNAEELQLDENLGRLKTTTANGDIDGDGDYDEIYAYGARSFSIWSTSGSLVYDSNNQIENITLTQFPTIFNQDEGEVDGRSDDKGPEPEAIITANIKGNSLAFVGLERTSGVMVYDINAITNPVYLDFLYSESNQSPEGIIVIQDESISTDSNWLVVTYELSGTVAIYEIK